MNNKNHSEKNSSSANGKGRSAEHDEQARETAKVQQDENSVVMDAAEYEKLKADAAKSAENWDKLVRLQADFENARKRWDRERAEFAKYANEELLCDLLNIVDELERSLELTQQKQENYEAFLKGVEMILAHLHDLMKKNGVKAMECQGKCFDPQFHEALMTVEKDDCPEHTVVDEMQKGYFMNERVLRTAKVQVSRKKAKEHSSEDNK